MHYLPGAKTTVGLLSGALAYEMRAVISTQDDAGELVGRLILMLAYDYAAESSPRRPPNSPPYFSAGVKVETFLHSLISNEHVERFLDSKSINFLSSSSGADNRLLQDLNVPLRKTSSNATIRFTHSILAAAGVHVGVAWEALCRRAAIHLPPRSGSG